LGAPFPFPSARSIRAAQAAAFRRAVCGDPDFLGDRAHVSLRDSLQRGVHRAATGVGENDDERAFQMPHCVFDASELVIADYVPRDADHEQFSDPAAENVFGNDAGIRTGDDHGVRKLTLLRGFYSDGGGDIRFVLGGGQERAVARFQAIQRAVCAVMDSGFICLLLCDLL